MRLCRHCSDRKQEIHKTAVAGNTDSVDVTGQIRQMEEIKAMSGVRIFVSNDCGSVIEAVQAAPGAVFSCCGQELKELEANTSEGAAEKHLPAVEVDGSTVRVQVGSIAHPMTVEHSIGFVCLETKKGVQRVNLKPDEEPKACFAVAQGDRPVAVYAYCNLHGFWKTEL